LAVRNVAEDSASYDRSTCEDALYVLQRNAWVIDEKYRPNTGSLLRIIPPKLVRLGP
jgi:hypothetical protein